MTPEEKLSSITSILSKHRIRNIQIQKPESIDKIYSLFVTAVQHVEPETGEECNFYALYYDQVKKDYGLAEKYYLQAVEHKDSNAMNNLGRLYETFEQDVNKRKHYYTMAVEHGNITGMTNLGRYFEETEYDFVQMKKYYKLAIEKGNDFCAIEFFTNYYERQNKWNKALNLYMLNPNQFGEQIANVLGRQEVLQPFLLKYQNMIKENTELKFQVEHYRFKPGREGAKQAKDHFESLIS